MSDELAQRLAVGDPILRALEQRAEHACRAGRFEEAEGYLQRVLELHGQRRSARRMLGQVQLERGAYQQAFETFEGLCNEQPHDGRSACCAGESMYYAGQLRIARRWLEHALDVVGRDQARCRRRARILLRKIARRRRAR